MEPRISTGWIDIPVPADGAASTMSGYLATPAAAGDHPNVLVGFELFGVTGYVRGIAERLARVGYNALVPDFYHRQGHRIELSADEAGRARGFELLHDTHREGVRRDVQAAITHLTEEVGGTDRTAMIGLSVGGHIAYYAATQLPLAALIVFYPGWLTGTDIPLSRPEPTLALTSRIAGLGTPVLFVVGERDELIPDVQRQQIAARLDDAGVRHDMVIYPDAPHGFCCDERDSYRPLAAADAWARTTRMLADALA